MEYIQRYLGYNSKRKSNQILRWKNSSGKLHFRILGF